MNGGVVVGWFAEAAEIPQGIDAIVPPWARDMSLVTLAILIAIAFYRGWVYSPKQHERELEAERKAAEIWEANFNRLADFTNTVSDALAPVLAQNEAILKVVTQLQEEQRRLRERGNRR